MSNQTIQVKKIDNALPKVVIVGRPNVGKSSLFNRIMESRVAIVQFEKGTTRDRVVAKTSWSGRSYDLMDTGGYTWAGGDAQFGKLINKEIKKAIEESDVLVFVVDGSEGLHPQDELIADMLRDHRKNTILVVNKLDTFQHFALADEFYKLGFQNLIKISALHGLGISDLLDVVVQKLPEADEKELPPHDFSICIVGEPNAGKSTYFNALLNEERAMVSEVPGTTRDVIAEMIEYKGKKILLKDTAGIKPVIKMQSAAMRFSISRAKDAIEKAELILFMFDGNVGLQSASKDIGAFILECKKPCVIVINKWDLIHDFEQSKYIDVLRRRAAFLSLFPVVFISAKNKKNILLPLDQAIETYGKHHSNIKTKDLNELLTFLKTGYKIKEPAKLKYITQVRNAPPHFVLMGRRLSTLKKESVLFIKNQIRERFDLEGTPIELSLREEQGGEDG